MEIEIVKKIKANVKYIHFDIPLYEGDIEYHETDEELIRRTNLSKIQKSEQEARELKLLKQYMESHKDVAVKYMKELNLI